MALTYVGRFFSNVKGFYDEINPATLSGAIDVIVIQQEDGSFLCSPFHVKFGKLGVIRSREKIVDIEINEEYIEDLHMKLGESGEAFFVQPQNSTLLNHNAGDKDITSTLQENNKIEDIDGCQTYDGGPIDYAASIASGDEDLATSPIWSGAEDDGSTNVKHFGQVPIPAIPVTTMITVPAKIITREDGIDHLDGTLPPKTLALHHNKGRSSPSQTSSEHETNSSGVAATSRTAPFSRRKKKTAKKNMALNRQSNNTNIVGCANLVNQNNGDKDNASRKLKRAHVSLDSGLNQENPTFKEGEEMHSLTTTSRNSANYSSSDYTNTSHFNQSDEIDGKRLTHFPRKHSWPGCFISLSDTDVSAFLGALHRSSATNIDDYVNKFGSPDKYKSDTELENKLTPPILTPLYNNANGSLFQNSSLGNNDLNSSTTPLHLNDEIGPNTQSILSQRLNRQQTMKWRWGKLPEKKKKATVLTNNLHKYSLQHTPPPSPSQLIGDQSLENQMLHQNVTENSKLYSDVLAKTPTKQPDKKLTPLKSGIYLDDLKSGEIDPQTVASYFPSPHYGGLSMPDHSEGISVQKNYFPFNGEVTLDDENDLKTPTLENIRELPPTSPNDDSYRSLTESLSFCELSLCGFTPSTLLSSSTIPSHSTTNNVTTNVTTSNIAENFPELPNTLESPFSVHVDIASFETHKVSYDDLVNDSSIFLNQNLVVRLGQKYYPWQIAVPLIITLFVYNKPIPENCLSNFVKLLPPVKRTPTPNATVSSSSAVPGKSSWFSWRRHPGGGHHHKTTQNLIEAQNNSTLDRSISIRSEKTHHKNGPLTAVDGNDGDDLPAENVASAEGQHQTQDDLALKRSASFDAAPTSNKEKHLERIPSESSANHKSGNHKWIKSLRLTSEQIAKLNLREGINDVTFSVTTQFQGTTRCASHIFLWKFDDKLVISDIDGTITKSDVLGHIFPFLGKDWSQYGVAELYSRICKNGYKFVYLSSRAIGQAPGTRGYLNSFKQNNMPLPQGPILLNPNSLLSAIHKEVIEKKPEEFKISCLKDIRALFPAYCHPFYAGFGNRISDVYAYRAVDIPISRVFTINYKGEISVDLTKTFLTSYSKLQDLADQVFPPVMKTSRYYHYDNAFSYDMFDNESTDKERDENQPDTKYQRQSIGGTGHQITNCQRRSLPPAYSFVVKSHANDTLLEADKYSNFTYWRQPMVSLSEPPSADEAENTAKVITNGIRSKSPVKNSQSPNTRNNEANGPDGTTPPPLQHSSSSPVFEENHIDEKLEKQISSNNHTKFVSIGRSSPTDLKSVKKGSPIRKK